MKRFPGFPIIDSANRLDDQIDNQGYAVVRMMIVMMPIDTDKGLRDLEASLRYLSDYASVSGTYNRFRSEIQRFLNYLWVVTGRTLDQVDAEVVASYFKFIKKPPPIWISADIAPGFFDKEGAREMNGNWRPFTMRRSASKDYSASPASLKSSKTALASYFRFLRQRGILNVDPFLEVRRRDVRANSKAIMNRPETTVRRYSNWQWNHIRDTLEQAANENPEYERHLFVVVTMKSLFLRVGELAVRLVDGEQRWPTFRDFQRKETDGEEYWSYYVFGKGDKARSVTCPDQYMEYLRRWRKHLDCETPNPLPRDSSPILPSKRGGGLGARQVQRICEEGVALAAKKLADQGLKHLADDLYATASETHYLRHTGASQAIENGADIRHISEELGHRSAAFTEELYVHSDQARRRAAGRKRAV